MKSEIPSLSQWIVDFLYKLPVWILLVVLAILLTPVRLFHAKR